MSDQMVEKRYGAWNQVWTDGMYLVVLTFTMNMWPIVSG